MNRSKREISMCVSFISSMEIYFVLIKNPAKTNKGIMTGTTNAEAASGDGIETPIIAPKEPQVLKFKVSIF